MLLSQPDEDSLIPPRMGSGTRFEAVGILLLRRGQAQRIRGRVGQREAGVARAARYQEISLGRARSREARGPHGRQITS